MRARSWATDEGVLLDVQTRQLSAIHDIIRQAVRPSVAEQSDQFELPANRQIFTLGFTKRKRPQ